MIEMDVIRIAENKKILDGDINLQILKSIISLEVMQGAMDNNDEHAMKFALGDALIGMICAAAELDLDLTKCLELSYEKFKSKHGN